MENIYLRLSVLFFSIFSALVFGHVVGDRLSLFFFLFFSKYDTWDQLVCHIRFIYNWCSRQVRGLEPDYPDWDLPVRMVLTFFSMIDDVSYHRRGARMTSWALYKIWRVKVYLYEHLCIFVEDWKGNMLTTEQCIT